MSSPDSHLHKHASFHILRIGMAVTFLWIGLLMFQDPTYWAGFLPEMLIKNDPMLFVYIAAGIDVVIGLLLLFDHWVFWIASFAALHLLGILIISGIDIVTVRDIGLFAGALALMSHTWPKRWHKR
jgi:uncharacterized membrane protein YkgB